MMLWINKINFANFYDSELISLQCVVLTWYLRFKFKYCNIYNIKYQILLHLEMINIEIKYNISSSKILLFSYTKSDTKKLKFYILIISWL